MERAQSVGLICLFAVYVLWGSTFLGIRLAVETIPPLMAAMLRHATGGFLLGLTLAVMGKWVRPLRSEFVNALWIGAITAGVSNGALMLAEVSVPSACAAIAFTTMPLFMLLLNWFAFERVHPSIFDWVALPLGLIGSGLVILTGHSLSGGHLGLLEFGLLILSPLVWAIGSLLSRRVALPKSVLTSASIQMIGGALLVGVLSSLRMEWTHFHVSKISVESLWGLIYLSVGGSFLGFTAFAVAIQNLEPRIVATYAFVNPLFAVALGTIVGEQLDSSFAVGSILCILSVVLTFVGAKYRRQLVR